MSGEILDLFELGLERLLEEMPSKAMQAGFRQWAVELKNRATEILRQLREDLSQVEITYCGRPLAALWPLDEESPEEDPKRAAERATPGHEVTAELERLRKEIDGSWKSSKTAVEIVSEQRR